MIVDKKKNKGLCVAYRCMQKHSKRDRFCHKHRKRFQKHHNPIVYTFGILKQNARRRGKPFGLTIAEFRDFCKETNYMELKGKFGKSASIDCKINKLGYVRNNIQALSLSENSRKGVGDCPF